MAVYINNITFNNDEFHNGEVILKRPVNFVAKDTNTIKLVFKDNRDITLALFARQWLKEKYPDSKCDLVMMYCPYERMDREINDQLFSMKYFAEILSKFEFNTVYILDAHSRVCIDMLQDAGLNVKELDLNYYIQKVIKKFKPDLICYPDKGAYNKYPSILTNIDLPYFFGEKTRDFENKGKINSYKLVDAPDLNGKKVLIIDDICCLGGTAYEAAKEIKLNGASEVAFYISHCEEGIFVGRLLSIEPFYPAGDGENYPWAGKYRIDKVYTADTMELSKQHDNIEIVK